MTELAMIGFGIMGSGMARNLLAAGHDVLMWNRTKRKETRTDFAKLRTAGSIAEAVAGQKIVLVTLTGPDAQRDTLLGENGVFAKAQNGAIIIDTTTTDPTLTAHLAETAASHGLHYLDAPVFGSRNEAWEGKLDFVCGGDEKIFREIEPLLQPMAASVHYMGGSTKGAAAKLVGNLLVLAQMVSLGEALSLARKAGLEPGALMGFLDVTDFSSPLIRGVGRASLAGDFSPHFYLKHMLKDARLISAYTRHLGVPAANSNVSAELYQAAVNKGLGDLNASALHKLAFELAGLE